MSTGEGQIGVNTNLQKQSLSNLDIGNLTPLSPEVISRQATINIGTIGHVAHGKSTVVKAISGVQTVRFKNELERNITIKLERISHEKMKVLLSSPKLLRDFEAQQAIKLWKRQEQEREQRRQYEEELEYMAKTELSSICSTPCNSLLSIDIMPYAVRIRDNSVSPSSGYASSCNGELFTGGYSGAAAGVKEDNANRKRRRSTCSSSAVMKNSTSKKRKIEYVVENIECIESVSGSPVFFVKWQGYPREQNTWESLENLSDCMVLEKFVESISFLHRQVIAEITQDMENKIHNESLRIDESKVDVKELDNFDPLKLKIDMILLAQFIAARSQSQREKQKITDRILQGMLMRPLHYRRKRQLNEIREWQQRMNSVERNAPITVENMADLDMLDPKFQYIANSIGGKDVQISNAPAIGCKCADGCMPSSKCCARMADSLFAYDKKGRLRIYPGEAIYECNKKCDCDDDCPNRIIQRGRQNSLCIFKTFNGRGWGARTERPMRKGEFVSEYVGEIITVDEANNRGEIYDAIGRTYLFDLDYNSSADIMYTIDAAMYGNVSHFFNHSCDPNLSVFPFWIDNLDINMPRLAFFTLRPIKAGEELTFDYIRTDFSADEYENLSDAEKVPCRCGAANCRKVLF